MKKLLVVLMTVALFAFPVSGFCLDLSEMTFGVNGGITWPLGDLDDAEADMGFTFGGQALMPSGIMDELSFGGLLNYVTMDGDDWEDKTSIIEILPKARYTFADTGDFQIFGEVGVGLFRWDNDDDDGMEIGLALGGGVKIAENMEVLGTYKRFKVDEDDLDMDVEYIAITFGYYFY